MQMTPALTRRAAFFGVLAAASSGPGQTYFIGLFGQHFQESFGLSAAALGSLYGVATLASGLSLFWLGSLADRLTLRRAISLAVFLVVGGSVLVASVTTAWLLGVGLFLLRLGGQGLAGHFAIVAAARFGGASRGRSIAIASMGFIFGDAAYPLLVTAALGFTDWSTVWLLSALILLALYLPVLRRLASGFPRYEHDSTPADSKDEMQWSRRRLVVSVPFLGAMGILLVPGFVVTAVFFHQSVLAQAFGWTPRQVASAFVLYAACQGASILLAGHLIDRLSGRALLRFYLLPLAGAFLGVLLAPSQAALWIFFGGMGLSAGANGIIGTAVWVEIFGLRQLGLIRGVHASVSVVMMAASPVLLGLCLSAGIGLATLFIPVAAYAALAPWLLTPLIASRQDRAIRAF